MALNVMLGGPDRAGEIPSCPATIAVVLVGRTAECAWLARQISRACRGEGGAILVAGEPGVGKTALLQAVGAATPGVNVLGARGVEMEASLGFAVLADICRPVLPLLEHIPGPQTAALSAALALGPAVSSDRFAAYTGMLSLLAVAAERAPLLVVVDDAQWLDRESAQALAFCARRIYAEPIALVLATRTGGPGLYPIDIFEQLVLEGLDLSSSTELVASVGGVAVNARVADRLRTATAGNPLALIEVGSQLTEAQLTGRSALDEPLPMGATIERLFWRQIAEQPELVQRALLVAAASNTGGVDEVVEALRTLGLGVDELERAETVGLVRVSDGLIEFKHPLVRAVVYRAAAAAERRVAHRALADAVTGSDAWLRRAWHRASASIGVDEEVAEELERAASALMLRTGFAAATDALERAGTLSGTDEKRGRRLLMAGTTAFLAGMLDRARDAAATGRQHTHDPRLAAECDRLSATVESYAGNVVEASRMLLAAATLIAPHDEARGAQFMTAAAIPQLIAGEVASAHDLARRAHDQAIKVGGETELLARQWLGVTRIFCGDRAGYQSLRDELEGEQTRPANFEQQLIAQWAVLCAVWVEDYDRARAANTALLSRWRAAGALAHLPFALAVHSELEFRAGAFSAALASAAEAVSIANETNQGATAAHNLTALARVEAVIGLEQDARAHVDEALQISDRGGAGSITVYARSALGLLELGISNPDGAVEQLSSLPALTLRQGLGEPGVVWWQPDWIEANIRVGNLAEAERGITRLASEASTVRRTWALAAVARYRGLSASDQDYERHFAGALELHDRTTTPFERARTQLCFGERLRRAGARRHARQQLEVALRTFRMLGAEPWAMRAENELSASGATQIRKVEHGTSPQQLLTPQELQIALAVSEGKTNKQVAAALFLSPKTIEFHLAHIYTKLNVRTRTQLALQMVVKPPAAATSTASEQAGSGAPQSSFR